ncbi:MAG: inorganic pyrophosphatase [Candidatus Parcubacteria bacterium]|jgi:inorganic pyrophosphatase
MYMNLWHDVSWGEDPEELNAIIEIAKGSNNKYEVDKSTGLIALDRANYNAASYPFDYGFVPQTLWEDGDPLDVVVLATFPLAPGILARVRPVAMFDMNDSGDSDAKIIAVPIDDPRWEDVRDLKDLNKHSLKEYRHFFETYKLLKSDDPRSHHVAINGVHDKAAAIEAIKHSRKLYQEKFSK